MTSQSAKAIIRNRIWDDQAVQGDRARGELLRNRRLLCVWRKSCSVVTLELRVQCTQCDAHKMRHSHTHTHTGRVHNAFSYVIPDWQKRAKKRLLSRASARFVCERRCFNVATIDRLVSGCRWTCKNPQPGKLCPACLCVCAWANSSNIRKVTIMRKTCFAARNCQRAIACFVIVMQNRFSCFWLPVRLFSPLSFSKWADMNIITSSLYIICSVCKQCLMLVVTRCPLKNTSCHSGISLFHFSLCKNLK